MVKEIERKFLVNPKKLPALPKAKNVIQGYFSEKPEIRVRITENQAVITVKTSQSDMTRVEFEYPIPSKDAEFLLGQTNLIVEKERSIIKLNGFEWVIDFYKKSNKGLVTAEVELPSEQTKVSLPLWIRKEVTGDIRYRNRSLAEKPYSNWNNTDS